MKTKAGKSIRWMATALAGVMLLAACGAKETPAPSGSSTESPSSGGQSSTGSSNAQRVKLSMFMSNSGVTMPENVSASDNKFINVVKDFANVDLDVEMVNSVDLATKFNLILASGNMPDIIHEHWLGVQAAEAGRAGAFLDLKPFYDKSEVVQKVITPEMLELARDGVSGSYFRMPMAWNESPQGYGIIARYDLVQKHNNGVWPTTVDEWVDLMRKMKREDPDSIPLTNWVIGDNLFAYGGSVVFDWYGARPYGFRVEQGRIIPNVLTPEYRAAVALLKQLYDEGILDKEFATNDQATYYSKWHNKNVLLTTDSSQQLPGVVSGFITTAPNPDARVMFAPFLSKYPAEVKDEKYVKGGFEGDPIQGHGLYIAASSKHPEEAWRAIEGFYSDELREKVFWGDEGETYTVKDGVRIPDADKMALPENSFGLLYALGIGFVGGEDVTKAKNEQLFGPEYAKMIYDSMAMIDQAAKQNGRSNFYGYIAPEEANLKNPESMQTINKITVRAIMGEITMEQFDQEIAGWNETYGKLIYEPRQAFMDENKDKLRGLGVKMVDW